jgi:GxxExxY protein
MTEILLKEESYKIIGACFEVHKILGHGFKESVYKDALEVESKKFDRIYIGCTSDLPNRFLSHNELATKGQTIKFRPW